MWKLPYQGNRDPGGLPDGTWVRESALFGIWQMYQEGVREYRRLQEYAHEGDETETETDETGAVKTKRKPEVDFEALKKISRDVVAWIRCKELGLDYPVVQGTDNSYYLTHSFTGAEHISGCIFMACINKVDFSDGNTILCGHNMKDGSMFGSFSAFQGDTATVFLYTPGETYLSEMADNLVVDVNDEKSFWAIYSAEAFGELSDAVAVRTGTALMPGIHLLTLSTCNSNASERHLIVCKRVADAEEKETEAGRTDASKPET